MYYFVHFEIYSVSLEHMDSESFQILVHQGHSTRTQQHHCADDMQLYLSVKPDKTDHFAKLQVILEHTKLDDTAYYY